MTNPAQISATLRRARAQMIHTGTEGLMTQMKALKLKKVPTVQKNNIVRGLLDIKRNSERYGFGENQKILLDRLIKRAKNLQTAEDLLDFHRMTCGLGLEQDLAKVK